MKERKPHTWKTREDPFELVWPQLKTMLERDQGLEAMTLMQFLLENYPGEFSEGQVRTLRRRIREWRILEGPESTEVFFRQNLVPGRQSQSDYTHCTELGITLEGAPFPHLLYHFMLPYSRWEYVWVCHTESYETLTKGYLGAIKELGRVAPDHRTDSLAAAVPIGETNRGVFQKRWEVFLDYHGAKPSRNNPGQSNENGSVEKSHDLFKHAMDQRLRLRQSRDFKSLADYESFLRVMVRERNRLRKERLEQEVSVLLPLPDRDWYEPKEDSVQVTGWSTVSVDHKIYSVPSRFIGQTLRALIYHDSVELLFGKHVVLNAEKPSGTKCINYRHLITHLMRKPGAFRNPQEPFFARIVGAENRRLRQRL